MPPRAFPFLSSHSGAAVVMDKVLPCHTPPIPSLFRKEKVGQMWITNGGGGGGVGGWMAGNVTGILIGPYTDIQPTAVMIVRHVGRVLCILCHVCHSPQEEEEEGPGRKHFIK